MYSAEMNKKDLSNASGLDLTGTSAEQWRAIELAVDSSSQDDMTHFETEKELLQAYICGTAAELGFEDELPELKEEFEVLYTHEERAKELLSIALEDDEATLKELLATGIKKMKRSFAKYGVARCIAAHDANTQDGEGAAAFGVHHKTYSAMIDAYAIHRIIRFELGSDYRDCIEQYEEEVEAFYA